MSTHNFAFAVACAAAVVTTANAARGPSQAPGDELQTHHSVRRVVEFPDHSPSQATVELLKRLDNECRRAGCDPVSGVEKVPPEVMRSLSTLCLEDQLEFSVYRMSIERPRTNRWVEVFRNVPPSRITPLLEKSLHNAIGHPDYLLALLRTIYRVVEVATVTCEAGFVRVLTTAVASMPERQYMDQFVPDLLDAMSCPAPVRAAASK